MSPEEEIFGPKPGDKDEWGNEYATDPVNFDYEDEEVLPAEAHVLDARRTLEEPDELEISEDSVALAFTAKFKNNLRYCKAHGSWYEWDGARWKRDELERAFHFAREIARTRSESKARMCKASFAAGVERFARSDPAHSISPEEWDRDPWTIGTPGGIVDLQTGQIVRPTPDKYITKLTGCAPESQEPRIWLDFLDQATRGDQDLISFLQRMCGYLLTGMTTEHAMFFVHGPGGNGKSVFLNMLTYILGDYAATAAIDTFTAGLGNRHPTELAMLQGARGVFANETEAGSQWAEARIKALTGGDPISARFMRQDFFTFKPQFKLIIVGNHAPSIRNVDEALRRRFNIIPFLNKPLKPDVLLEEKLRAEAGAIFGWMIDGCMDWQAHGLGRPKAIREATDDYFAEQDLFAQWMQERTTQGPGYSDTSGKLFGSFSSYMKAMGDTPGTARSFSLELQKRGFRRKKYNGQRVFEGISVINEQPESPYYD